MGERAYRDAICESCGQPADVRLRDGSTWCEDCNEAAHNLGYDQEKGQPLHLVVAEGDGRG